MLERSKFTATAARRTSIAAVLTLLLALGVIAPHQLQADSQQTRQRERQTVDRVIGRSVQQREARSPADPEDLRQALAVSRVFQDVARAVGPAVVHITTDREVQRRPVQPRISPFGRDPFDDFFERFFGPQRQPRQFEQPQPDEQAEPERMQIGQATGLIISREGHVVTNYHVIAAAEGIRVRLSTGREYDATVVGTDAETDIAVLQFEPEETLMPATFGDSSALNPGEWVIAVGSALGLENTVTTGVVSATGRQVGIIRDPTGAAGFEDFIQTDAAINPGNSGGPLLNLYGEVIGINTAIATRSGGYMGIGFAIPSSMVEPVVNAIIQDGEVQRAWLGVELSNLTPDLADSYEYDGTEGVLIADVFPGDPADEAGLRYGDIIVSVDGQPVRNLSQFRTTVAMMRPGTTVELRVFRNGEMTSKEVTLAERPSREEQIERERQRLPISQQLGLAVEELPSHLARQLGLRNGGVMITQVNPRSVAARAGLRPNDVILSVAGRDVTSVSEYHEALAEQDVEQGVRLRIRRGNITHIVILRLR